MVIVTIEGTSLWEGPANTHPWGGERGPRDVAGPQTFSNLKGDSSCREHVKEQLTFFRVKPLTLLDRQSFLKEIFHL